MEFKEFNFNDYFEDIKRIFKSANWSAYLQDDEKLKTAFEKSLYLLGAFEKNRLVGFIRCVGDGEHIVLIQDLIVDPDFYRQKIGTKLFNFIAEKYSNVRSLCLFTDIYDIRDNEFYKSIGLVKIEEKNMVSYIR
ncbi:MAG: GNAT family N-acetyltransferase [Parvimonas sp.]|uniref:GNAT family N-acetyltransferase n=1 Tax=Parvimonas sp. TaxID=1944660 RepID=UPI0025E8DBDB|nr:GNAT family N-acetyltransferase [Parvimonas sp.]MCI5997109.1 GNAT family N-acetyltransferase [Parvimonas sp.]